MAYQEPVWAELRKTQGLAAVPYDKAVGWAFGDFVFGCAFHLVSDMGKIRRAGFAETVSTEDALIAAIQRQQEVGILPR